MLQKMHVSITIFFQFIGNNHKDIKHRKIRQTLCAFGLEYMVETRIYCSVISASPVTGQSDNRNFRVHNSFELFLVLVGVE